MIINVNRETGVKNVIRTCSTGETSNVTDTPSDSSVIADESNVCATSTESACVFNVCDGYDCKVSRGIIRNHYFRKIPLPEPKQQINTGGFWDVFRIIRSEPDGHCLISSVSKSLTVQLKRAIDNEFVLKLMQTELNNNIEMYKGFLEETQRPLLVKYIKDYIYRKIYNSLRRPSTVGHRQHSHDRPCYNRGQRKLVASPNHYWSYMPLEKPNICL